MTKGKIADLIFKLKILWLIFPWQHWVDDVWKRDLDERYCCEGTFYDECGCGGLTIREIYEPNFEDERKAGGG